LLLANYLLNKYKNEVPHKSIKGFSKETKEAMLNFTWPGNIRELENRIRRALILAENPYITPLELGFEDHKNMDISLGKLSLKEARQNTDVAIIKKALQESKGNMSLAAKMLGVTRPTFYDLVKKYRIDARC